MSGSRRKCNSETLLVGKTIVITGIIAGTREVVARHLYRRGARVILASKYRTETNAAAERLKTVPPSTPEGERYNGNLGEIVVCELDLSSFTSVRKCAKYLTDTEANIHMLINSDFAHIGPFTMTEDGFEFQLQINYLGHFLLTLLLLPKLKSSGSDARIINMSSDGHREGDIDFNDINLEKCYTPEKAYCQSELAIILFTRELARRLKVTNEMQCSGKNRGNIGILVALGLRKTMSAKRYSDSIHFRVVRSMLHPSRRLSGTVNYDSLAQTMLYCALDEKAAKQTGLYYQDCCVVPVSARARNDKLALRLWNESLKLVDLESQDILADIPDTLPRSVASFQLPQKDEQPKRNSQYLSEPPRKSIGKKTIHRLRRLLPNKYEPL